jgi:exonuclease SbcD
MKLIHTSDWHLGKMIFGRSLLQDQEYFIRRVFLPCVEEERPDCVLLAGDVFDRQVAPPEAIHLFEEALYALHAMGVAIAVIAGNHDGADRLAPCARLLRGEGVYIASRLEDSFTPVTIARGEERVHLHLLPYFEPAQARAALRQEDVRGMQGAYAAVLQKVRETLCPRECNILVGHCFVTGCSVSDSENPLYVGGSAEVAAGVFEGFDYVALGHLHASQRAGEVARYAGAPLQYSFEERGQKSLTIVETSGKHCALRQIPVSPLRRMRLEEGDFAHWLRLGRESQEPCEDYLFLRLTDQAPVYMPVEQLREYYPNLLGLTGAWLQPQSGQNGVVTTLRQNGGELELFTSFMEQVCGQAPEEEDRRLFLQACRIAQEAQEEKA